MLDAQTGAPARKGMGERRARLGMSIAGLALSSVVKEQHLLMA